MKLLLISAVFPTPRRPTKGVFNRELVRGLRQAGDDVRVIAPVPWTDLYHPVQSTERDDGVQHPVWWYPPRFAHSYHHLAMQLSLGPAIGKTTRNWRPDAVLGYWTHPDGTTALHAARRIGSAGVLLVGGSDVRVLARDPKRRAVIVRTLKDADHVFTVGDTLRQNVIALGIAGDRVSAMQRGVDASRFHPGDRAAARQRLGLPLDQVIFVWAGKMVPVKNLDGLLQAWAGRRDVGPAAMLVLIGDGPQRGKLEELAQPFQHSVRFTGDMPHDALPDWFRAADALLLPSHSEGIPNVLLEGLACGTAFIATDVGGISELAGGDNVLVPAGDTAALRSAIEQRITRGAMAAQRVPEVPDRAKALGDFRQALRSVIEARK